MSAFFLTLDEGLAIHAHQIARYGGALGLRDRGVLESALAMPAATFGGEYLHPSLHEQGAAYLFHLVKNHPFVDGNKRTGFLAAYSFLYVNGLEIVADEAEVIVQCLSLAASEIDEAEFAAWLRENVQPR